MEDEDLKNFVGTLAKRLHGRFDAMRKEGAEDEMGSRVEAVLQEPEAGKELLDRLRAVEKQGRKRDRLEMTEIITHCTSFTVPAKQPPFYYWPVPRRAACSPYYSVSGAYPAYSIHSNLETVYHTGRGKMASEGRRVGEAQSRGRQRGLPVREPRAGPRPLHRGHALLARPPDHARGRGFCHRGRQPLRRSHGARQVRGVPRRRPARHRSGIHLGGLL